MALSKVTSKHGSLPYDFDVCDISNDIEEEDLVGLFRLK